MEEVKWDKILILGIPDMDHQHLKLVKLEKDLDEKIEKKENQQVLADGLKELIDETQNHFKDEEKFMAFYSYPDIEIHIKMHKMLMRKINEMSEKLNLNPKAMVKNISSFIVQWLGKHIIGMDKGYADFIKSKK